MVDCKGNVNPPNNIYCPSPTIISLFSRLRYSRKIENQVGVAHALIFVGRFLADQSFENSTNGSQHLATVNSKKNYLSILTILIHPCALGNRENKCRAQIETILATPVNVLPRSNCSPVISLGDPTITRSVLPLFAAVTL